MKDMWRRLPLKKKIVVLLTLLCIGLTIGYLPEPYPHVLTKEEIKEAESVSRSQTEVLAPNVSLIDQAGHTVSMQSLYNKKPVLLYFWMSWSDMAAKELPVLDDMYRQQGRNVYFVIVCLDRGDAARQRIESGWSYDMPLYFASMETAGTYNVYEVPQWIMIDRGGTIREKRTGSLDQQQLEYALARSLK
ncbi:TlpA disulfide reductase family protein [Megasphaera sp. AM44-1BH]|uniref:TlpA family protein disulfide reductase n=1 Tax=Megasphaera sp. AM44-1BH TaxID=2292358 RepID=UPI0013146421|nr:TlpA disulfide reductase family protein [Megasphaera sp. AM44-1BH]